MRATTVDEAIAAVSGGAVPYAGGTELLLAMRAGLLRPETLVDLKGIPRLAAIDFDGDGFIIGGSATHAAAIRHEGLFTAIPILREVLLRVGNPRVRAAGTLGGNLCFAEPKSDVSTLLIALDATLTLVSSKGSRTLTVEEFSIGPYTTALEDGEILASIHLPASPHPVVYEKFQTMERPTVGVAAMASPDGSGMVVVGAAGPVPQKFEFRSRDKIDPGKIAGDVEIIPDLTGSERYKRHVTRMSIERALARIEETV